MPQVVIAFFGVLKAGGAAVFMPPMTEPDDLVRQVKDVEATVLVTLTSWAGLAARSNARAACRMSC